MHVSLVDEMRKSYLDYAMSVIVSRAIPDVCDGLKPVHRRILYFMKEHGFEYNKSHRKSANVTGGVMAKYHPHGNMAIYDAMVRMAQPFSMRLMLVDGQGNFGSMDGDPPAAERYTEARLSHPAHYLLADIDEDTVDFHPNYDETTKEPAVLPARFPNLLVNGAGGIAVGMATNIPPHNLGEVIDACCAYVDNPALTLEEAMQYIPGPDFPTGAHIMGRGGIREAYRAGRGSVVMRSVTHIEEIGNRQAIIVTEVPYQVNKARMVERIAEIVNGKIVEGIADLRDESNREGVRVVIEIKKGFEPYVILNQLYKHTPLQTSFGCNILALDKGQPRVMGLLKIIQAFIDFRQTVIIRRTYFKLGKAREKAHIYLGLAVAVANIDEVIRLIRAASTPAEARAALMGKEWPAESVLPLIRLVDNVESPALTYRLSEQQTRSILDLRLHRLTGLEREKIAGDLNVIIQEISEYLKILGDRAYFLSILKQELIEVKEKFATPRRTMIIDGEATSGDIEDFIQKEDMVVTVTHNGYIKRVPLSTYRAQRRGGKGRSGMSTREEDFVDQLFVANTHTPILFFTSLGKVHALKVHRLPVASPQSPGKAIINILPLEKNEKISTIMPMPEDETSWESLQLMFATDRGNVRRNPLMEFANIRANGKIAMKLEEEGEQLIGVAPCDESSDILLTSKHGRCVRFQATDVRVFQSRNSTGVRGIRLQVGDEVVSMSILKRCVFTLDERDAYLRLSRARRGSEEATSLEGITLLEERYQEMHEMEEFILTVAENGYGKRSSAYEYRLTNRGTQGIANMDITYKTGLVVDSFPVKDDEQLMLVTDKGQITRSRMNEIRIAGRKTQGVKLFRLEHEEKVVSVDCLEEGDPIDSNVVSD